IKFIFCFNGGSNKPDLQRRTAEDDVVSAFPELELVAQDLKQYFLHRPVLKVPADKTILSEDITIVGEKEIPLITDDLQYMVEPLRVHRKRNIPVEQPLCRYHAYMQTEHDKYNGTSLPDKFFHNRFLVG